MPKLFSSQRICRVLEKNDFTFTSQKGSHIKYKKIVGTESLVVIVPAGRRQIPEGTFRSILRQSELTREHFAAKKGKI